MHKRACFPIETAGWRDAGCIHTYIRSTLYKQRHEETTDSRHVDIYNKHVFLNAGIDSVLDIDWRRDCRLHTYNTYRISMLALNRQ